MKASISECSKIHLGLGFRSIDQKIHGQQAGDKNQNLTNYLSFLLISDVVRLGKLHGRAFSSHLSLSSCHFSVSLSKIFWLFLMLFGTGL